MYRSLRYEQMALDSLQRLEDIEPTAGALIQISLGSALVYAILALAESLRWR